MTLTRRGLLAASALAAAGPALAQGAAPFGLRPGKPLAGRRINVLAVVTPQFDGLMLRTPEFTELTGIEVRWDFVPFVALQEKVASTGIAADGSYDVVNYLDSWGPPNAHWFKKLDPWLKRDGLSMDRYPEAFAKGASFKGEVVGLPMRSHAQLFFYRKDVFDELGLAAPTSWDEVVAAGKAIRAKKPDLEPLALSYHADGNRQNLFHWMNFVWSAGGQVLDERMRPAWTSAAAMEATEFYIGLLTKEKIANPASVSFVEQDARVSFQQGKSAMIPVWWWAYSPMITAGQSVLQPPQVSFTGIPAYKGKVVTSAITMPFAINDTSRQADAAWEFLKWVSNPELDKRNATERSVAGKPIQNNVVNHKANLLDSAVNEANAGVPAAGWESLKHSDVMPQLAEWPEVGDAISNAIARAAAGGDTKRLLTEAASRAGEILRRAGYR
ncbi:sugar ABC transporter substrate-binding protein (plasmid) [Roseomonas sp. OT10]|uniref:ABC transporter substrate-binding protein n=1 Tax=Roseomonas cutis TaxID=2897332 RepID=UPI001E44CE7A|nr:sugar ABC transporter substrate-binding protein [Roseomonas sp. OT10]UFN51651.1 sugar ABC transporter substrate-binding protein [Roseomonas sp. OT10]